LNTFLFKNLPSFFQFIYNIKIKVIQIINTNDLIVEASVKKYVTTQGFELWLPAQVTSTVTTTSLRMTYTIADNKKLSTWFACLPSDGAWVQISLVLLLILQSKNNIYKQSCALACQCLYFCVLYGYKNDSHSLDVSKFILVLYS
jgi:hypothetical protein